MMKTYMLSDLARITRAKPRLLQHWTKSGVLRALRGTEGEGSGVYRNFSQSEAMIACVIAPVAALHVSVAGLKIVAQIIRSHLRGKPELLEQIAAESEAIKFSKLHAAIAELRRVWWEGADLDKDKIAAACLVLFRVDHKLHNLGSTAKTSWYCDQCQVEVYQLRCPHCGKTKREAR